MFCFPQSFLIGPYPGVPSATCPDPKNHSTCCQGQKPSVILRGAPTIGWAPPSVYLLSFRDVTFWGGGEYKIAPFLFFPSFFKYPFVCPEPVWTRQDKQAHAKRSLHGTT